MPSTAISHSGARSAANAPHCTKEFAEMKKFWWIFCSPRAMSGGAMT